MKSKNKAFTLVELIGVVAILAIMLLVSVPALTKTLKNNEKQKYNTYIKNLELATENYIVKNVLKEEVIDNDTPYYVSLKTLIQNGYFEDTMVNPETEKEISTDTRIKVTRNDDDSFKYDVQEYYNSTDDYNSEDLVIHYDAVEYRKDNIMKNYTQEVDLNLDESATWTENGIIFHVTYAEGYLNEEYDAEEATMSINLKPNDFYENYIEINHDLYFLGIELNDFYLSGLLSMSTGDTSIPNPYQLQNQNYTLTIVSNINDPEYIKLYINGNKIELNLAINTPINRKLTFLNIQSYVNWTMNNLLIYNRALTEAEIKEIYELDKERFGE